MKESESQSLWKDRLVGYMSSECMVRVRECEGE
jgi:hypothetical protein